MARTIDDKVVAMSFESSKFVAGVSSTISALDKLKAALKFPDIGKGFQDIENAAHKVTFGGLSSAIDRIKGKFGFGAAAQKDFGQVETASNKTGLTGISTSLDKLKSKFGDAGSEADKAFASVERSSGRVTFQGLSSALENLGGQFSILSGAAAVALGNIATKGAQAGLAFAKSFTIAPIQAGLSEYSTNLNSIQTILSNTQASGAGLKDVNAALQELNTYSDKTIYNFSEMARNIGTFTAAGVDLKTSTSAIKGIANVAALSGSNSQQASTAMYQLSQAIAAGRVSLQDWNSVVNAGMGGTVFQRALTETAVKMGTLKDGAVKLSGKMKNVTVNGQSFRNSIMAKPGEESWLTSKVLTTALGHFTGDMTKAQLAAQGFNDEQIKAIQKQAKLATDAATKVKTLKQVLDVAKETAGSGWAQTWQLVFGNFKEARNLFTGMSNAINGFINANAKARNEVLGDWKKLGGRTLLIDGIKDAFHNLSLVLKPIKQAFRDIFPAKTGRDLVNFTQRFHDLVENLKPSKETVENLRRTFRGLFALLDIGKQIVGGILTAIGSMFGAIGHGSGGVLELTGNLGDMIASFNQWLHFSGVLNRIFSGLGDILAIPVHLIGKLSDALNDVFSGGKSAGGDIVSSFSGIAEALTPGTTAIDRATSAWGKLIEILDRIGNVFKPVVESIGETFSNMADAVADAISSNNWDKVFSVIQTGLIAGIFLTIKKALGGGLSVELGTGGVIDNISKSFGTLQKSMVSLQSNIQAHTLVAIATAIGILTASVVALSLISPTKLTQSMTAITVGMAQLMATLAIMNKFTAGGGFAKMPVIAGSLILLAGALDTLTIAMVVISKLDWEEIGKGLAGIGGMLLGLSLAVQPLSKAGPGMIIAGAGLIGIGVALNIIAASMKIFATMKWEDIAKGLVAMDLALGVIAITTRGMGPQMLLIGPALIAVGIALNAIAAAVKIFGAMDLATLGKGIGAIALSLVAIAAAMWAMPPHLPLTAAGLILVGVALQGIAGAIALLGNMSIGTLAKGIIAIGASLVVLASGLTLMIASLPGAAALLVAAGALAILVPVIALMGAMPLKVIAKGLGLILLSLVSLSVAGAAAAPGLIALGAALTLLGVGIVLVGSGIYLMTSALVKLAGPGAKGIGVVLASFTAFIAILPKVIINFIKGLVEIIAAIAELAPKVAVSMAKIIDTMLGVVIKEAPRFAQASIAIIDAFLTVLNQRAPELIEAGWHLLLALLTGIDNHIVEVTKKVSDIIVKFLEALATKIGDLTEAGSKVLAALLLGIANHISNVTKTAVTVMIKFVGGIIDNLGRIATAGLRIVTKLLTTIADQARNIIAAGTKIILQIVQGIGDAASRVATAALNTATHFISSLAKEIPKQVDRVATAVIQMINDMADVIRNREPEFIGAVANIGKAIVLGMADAIRAGVGDIKDALLSLIPGPLKKFAGRLGIKSPSKVFHKLGGFLVKGFSAGIRDGMPDALASISSMMTDISATISKATTPKIFTNIFGPTQRHDFASELLGTPELSDQVTTAFKNLGDNIKNGISDVRNSIKDDVKALHTDQRNLDKFMGKVLTPKQEKQYQKAKDAYDKHYAVLLKHQDQLNTLNSANALVTKGMAEQQAALRDRVKAFDDISKKIQLVKDEIKSLTEQYSALPATPGSKDAKGHTIKNQAALYIQTLQKQAGAVARFSSTLQKLKDLGLDDVTYQKLLTEGIDAQAFADSIVAGGKTAVDSINTLDSQLASNATTLATNAAAKLYNAGVQAAEGLVAGLESQQGKILLEMNAIADVMVKAIKKALKIKSPSRVFGEIGTYSMQGLAKGFTDSSKVVTDAVYGVSEDAIATIKSSMRDISDAVLDEIDPSPTITPILDLSQIKKDASQVGQVLAKSPISINASSNQASAIDADIPHPGDDPPVAPVAYNFEQNNISPKALSEIDIYRNTKNLISQAQRAPVPSP